MRINTIPAVGIGAVMYLMSAAALFGVTAGACGAIAAEPSSLHVAKAGTLPLARRGGIDLDGQNKGVFLLRSAQQGMLAARFVNNRLRFDFQTDPGPNFRLVGAADFDRNGISDLVYQNITQGESGETRIWSDFTRIYDKPLRTVKLVWDVQASGDLDGDGFADLVWRYNVAGSPDTGVSYIWFTNGASVTQVRKRGGAPLSWTLLGAMDLNGDGAADMVYVSPDGGVRVLMATAQRTCANYSAGSLPAGFAAHRYDDFSGRGRGDLLLRNPVTGEVRLMTLDARSLQLPPPSANPDDPNASCTATTQSVPVNYINLPVSEKDWQIYATADLNGDGTADIVWQTPGGNLAVWLLSPSGALPAEIVNVGTVPIGGQTLFPAVQTSGIAPAATSYPLTLTVDGKGAGLVSSLPGGLSCAANCNAAFSIGSIVTLTATPTGGSTFIGWSGPCVGTGTCTVSMNDARSVGATFGAPRTLAAGGSLQSSFIAAPTNAGVPISTIKSQRMRADVFVDSSTDRLIRGVTITASDGRQSNAFFSQGIMKTIVNPDGSRVEFVQRSRLRMDYLFFAANNSYTGGIAVVRASDSATWYFASILGSSALQGNTEINGSFGGSTPGSFSLVATAGADLDTLYPFPPNVGLALEEFYKLTRDDVPAKNRAWVDGAWEGPLKTTEKLSLGGFSSRNATASVGFGLAAVGGVACFLSGVCSGAIAAAAVVAAGTAMNVTGASAAIQSLVARAGQRLLGDTCSAPDAADAGVCTMIQDEILGVQDDPVSSLRNRVNSIVDGVTSRWNNITQSVADAQSRLSDLAASEAARYTAFNDSARPALGTLPSVDARVSGIAVSQFDNQPYGLNGTLRRDGQLTVTGSSSTGSNTIQITGNLNGNNLTGTTTITRSGSAGAALPTNGSTRPVSACNTVTESGGQGSFSRSYSIGTGANFTFSYDAYTIPDAFIVYIFNSVANQWETSFATPGLVSGSATRTLQTRGSTFAAVTVTAPNSGTAWEFTLGCAR
jgi:hypothetical protein